SRSGFPWAVSDTRRRSPRSSRSWLRTRAATSPASSCLWTAAWRRSDSIPRLRPESGSVSSMRLREHNEMKSPEAKMSQTRSTYRAVQAVSPGKLELTEKPLLDPPPSHVRIRVEACGVCHSDAGTVEGVFPIQWPRVPGHEAVGRVDALGEGVEGWAVG